ncbi:MAG: AAA family ATPase [Beduini sp.]
MNIKEAKQQIKNAIISYSTKDEYGHMIIPVNKQRPIFLVGAPGIGKTAIMEQIVKELDIALVSYSMTHHTRQSALGLPFIVDKNYGGVDYKVSEYTMSEIIASIYDTMEKTKKDSGILFLDEINCISETLAPSMLQFLQYKTFGRHQVPEGWIVVTAGNPPEYNNSVKEFDIAMWDRLKKIEVEADYETWKEYAINTNIHPVVTSYLNIKPSHFYTISSTVDGKNFVTARGWDDLSQMIILYETNQIEVDYNLISQYLQDDKIAKDFSHYYQLFHKYQADYKVDTILDGTSSVSIKERASKAKFDERLSLISLIMSQLDETISQVVKVEDAFKPLMSIIKTIPANQLSKEDYIKNLTDKIEELKTELAQKEIGNTLSKAYEITIYQVIALINRIIEVLRVNVEEDTTVLVKSMLQEELSKLKQLDHEAQTALEHCFEFFEEVFDEGQEMLILVTEMTINETISQYIYTHGCAKYYEHNHQLLFEDKQNELLEKIDAINLLDFDTYK